MFKFLILAFTCFLFNFSTLVSAKDMNCTTRQNSNFVKDAYGMYADAASKNECLKKCQDYAKRSIDSLAESDVVTKLSWTCAYNKDDIHTEKLK